MDMALEQSIDVTWRKGRGAEVMATEDPATQHVIGEIPAASAADTQNAVNAASVAQLQWCKTLGWSRAEILHRCADALVTRTEEAARLEAGMVGINCFAFAAAEAPCGGIKAPGMGGEGGSEGIHDFLNVKLAQVVA
jgi:acyl-CoA reductase-like NAD-dependent aldehyde dehydrogenase